MNNIILAIFCIVMTQVSVDRREQKLNSNSTASKIQQLPIPTRRMYVDRSVTKIQKEQFLTNSLQKGSKYNLLRGANGIANLSQKFPIQSLQKLVALLQLSENSTDIVNVDFALSNKLQHSSPEVQIRKGQILLLFSTARADRVRTAQTYYFLNGTNEVYSIGAKEAETLKSDYISTNLPALEKSIIKKDQCNLDKKTGLFSDTKSVSYAGADFYDTFITEVNYQSQQTIPGTKIQIKISRIDMYFSAYGKKGDEKGNYRHRLIIQFDLMHMNALGILVPLDLSKLEEWKRPEGFLYDKGHLCPDICIDDEGK